jgi:hypothetical protein
MEIMDGIHVLYRFELIKHGVLVDVFRRLDHEDAHPKRNSSLGRVQNQYTKEESATRVCVVPIAHAFLRIPYVDGLPPNKNGGKDHANRLDNIPDHMCQSGIQSDVAICISSTSAMRMIMTMSVAMTQNFHQDQIYYQAQDTDYTHHWRIDLLRIPHALHSFIKQDSSERPHNEDGKKRTKHLCLLEAICVIRGCRTLGQVQAQERNYESTSIGKHMRGICHDGQRIGEIASYEFYQHEKDCKVHCTP